MRCLFSRAAAALALTLVAPAALQAMTYTSVAAIDAGLSGGRYSGVGTVYVERVSSASTGLAGLCTGALLSSQAVLTAGHCLSNQIGGVTDAVTRVFFILPSLGEIASGNVYGAVSWQVNPLYDDDLLHGNDFALFSLAAPTSGHDSYEIFDGSPLGAFTRVGTGDVGGPQGIGTGVGGIQDYRQREGRNRYEAFGPDIDYASPLRFAPDLLLADFDDGTATHDLFGRIGLADQTGIAGESMTSTGDSGGPTFIDGKIAGIGSFLMSGGVFERPFGCGGPGSIDPYGEGGVSGNAVPLDQCANGSIGELMADTWLLPHADYIRAYVAGVAGVPEPATWLQLIAGLAVAGGTLRSRRRAAGLA